jgi:hypothetical protein
MSILGGLLGSEEKTVGKTSPTSSTTVSGGGSQSQQKLDPRMEKAIYGANGIMPNATDWYSKNKSGLTPEMVAGLNSQWNQLGASKQGFDQMQNMGMGMMSQGVAGNPFTGGGGIEANSMTFNPTTLGAGSQTLDPFKYLAPTATPAAAAVKRTGFGGGGKAAPAPAPTTATPSPGGWFDVEGMLHSGTYGNGNAGYSGYKAQDWSNPSMNVPTTSTAGFGGYDGYNSASGSFGGY